MCRFLIMSHAALKSYIWAWICLPVIRGNDISSVNESIVLEICLTSSKCFLPGLIDHLIKTRINVMNFFKVLTCSCRILMKKSHEFPSYQETLLARFKNQWSQCITNSQGSIIGTLISLSSYDQIINSSTHTTNTSSSCIDLIFTSNPSLITEFSIEESHIQTVTTIVLFLVR